MRNVSAHLHARDDVRRDVTVAERPVTRPCKLRNESVAVMTDHLQSSQVKIQFNPQKIATKGFSTKSGRV